MSTKTINTMVPEKIWEMIDNGRIKTVLNEFKPNCSMLFHFVGRKSESIVTNTKGEYITYSLPLSIIASTDTLPVRALITLTQDQLKSCNKLLSDKGWLEIVGTVVKEDNKHIFRTIAMRTSTRRLVNEVWIHGFIEQTTSNMVLYKTSDSREIKISKRGAPDLEQGLSDSIDGWIRAKYGKMYSGIGVPTTLFGLN